MKQILTTLLISTFIFACSKDDNTPAAGRESYQPEKVVIADAPVMYTNNGIVNDQALMKAFLIRRNIPLTAYAFNNETPDAGAFSAFSLEFKSENEVMKGNTKAAIISKTDSLLIIAELDSAVSVVGEKGWSDSLMDKVDKYGPLAECPTYYTAPCSYRKKYPIQIIDGQYYIPYVVATASTNATVPTIFGVFVDEMDYTHKSGEVMIFNKSMTTQLGGTMAIPNGSFSFIVDRNDTLVIQTMRQRLVKQ